MCIAQRNAYNLYSPDVGPARVVRRRAPTCKGG